MAGRIPREFIDELMTRVDIVDVINTRVPLKKKGREYVACCPFHNEKTPSFTVSPDKQFYHCFGCGAHGTALGFLLEYDHLEFPEAVQQLADSVGLEVPREGGRDHGPPPPSNRPLYELLERCARYYRYQLRHHREAPRAVEYLKGRGLSGAVAADFGLGFAPEGWDNLMRALGDDDQTRARLAETGMIIEKPEENKRYDRFRGRIMFPIRDARGRVVAFGGRVLGDAKPKYLNSPETPIFHKGRELYGLYEARQALRKIPRLLVVEGYMDVVALAQFGIRYGVATLGTAVTSEHLERLFRTTSEVVFCFDGDRAGREAAWRGLENALPLIREGRRLRFMFLPEGHDPDSLVREVGPEGFEAQVEAATALSDYLFQRLTRETDMGSLDGRARLIELSRPYLSNLSPGAFRELMMDRLAELAGMDRDQLDAVWEGRRRPRRGAAPPTAERGRPATRRSGLRAPSPVRRAIALLLQKPALARLGGDPGRWAGLELPGLELLRGLLELLQRHPELPPSALLEHWRGSDEGVHLERLARRNALLPEDEDLEAEFTGALVLLDRQRTEQRRAALLAKPFQDLSAEEKAELQALLKGNSSAADNV